MEHALADLEARQQNKERNNRSNNPRRITSLSDLTASELTIDEQYEIALLLNQEYKYGE